MGNGVSEFYDSIGDTFCAKPPSKQREEIKKELMSSVGNSKHTANTKYNRKPNRKRTTRNNINNNTKEWADSKEMESSHIWSTSLHNTLSSVYEDNVKQDINDNMCKKKHFKPIHSNFSPIPSNTSTVTTTSIVDIDSKPTQKLLTFEELILFSDCNELLIDGFLRTLNIRKHIISNIVLIIRDYSVPNWSDITSISVYLRVKPHVETEIDIMLAQDNDDGNPVDNIKINDNMITVQYRNDKKSKQFSRRYDAIFDGKTSQRQIYLQTAAPLMQACVDGFNVTIFAYGPAVCGKSYIIFGTNVEFGIAQRCIASLVYQLKQKHILGKIDAFKISLSGLRIWNNTLIDLFDLSDNQKQLFVKQGEKETDCAFVEGLVELEEMSLENAFKAINDCVVEKHSYDLGNDVILIIKIEQLVNNMNGCGKTIKSELKLVKCKASKLRRTVMFDMYDLVGEMNCITKKIYKETPFNHLMSDSFGGNCIATMIGCISSDNTNVKKAINTLKFGSAVMNVKNKPKACVDEWWDIYIQPQIAVRPKMVSFWDVSIQQPFRLMVDPKKTFGEIKHDVSKMVNIETKEITLLWDGVNLHNEQILSDSKVPKKGVICLRKKMYDTPFKTGRSNSNIMSISMTSLNFSNSANCRMFS